MGARKITNDTWVDILNRVVLRPRLKPAARAAGIDPSSLFEKIKASVAEPDKHMVEWLGTRAAFHEHMNTARKLAIVELDRAALEMALEGHSQPRYDAAGKPIWKTDPQVAADALTLDDFDWELKYGPHRRRDDVYARTEAGELIQEQLVTPANGALVAKILSALIPAYRENAVVEHHHTGRVWLSGDTQAPAAASRSDNLLGFDAPADRQERPTNLLALPRPCANSEEFDKKFRKRLLREVVLFRDADNKLLPPLPDDILIVGTPQYRALLEAKLLDGAKVMTPQAALDEGYENDWLLDLAPDYKPKPKPKPQPKPMPPEEVAQRVAAKIVEPPGKASARSDSENLGYGRPKSGGFRVVK
jgi:hypothetical protein